MDIETVKRFMPDLSDERAALYIETERAAKPLLDAAKEIAEPSLRMQVINAVTQTVQAIARMKPMS